MTLNKRSIIYVFSIAVLIVVFAGIHIMIRNFPLVWDEVYHTRQLTKFLHGIFTLDSGLGMLPGYHVLLTVVLFLTGLRDVESFRLINFLFSFILIGVVYKLNNHLSLYRRMIATGQFAFFPLFFMFHFLVYSDMMSLLSICIV